MNETSALIYIHEKLEMFDKTDTCERNYCFKIQFKSKLSIHP